MLPTDENRVVPVPSIPDKELQLSIYLALTATEPFGYYLKGTESPTLMNGGRRLR